MLEALRRMKLRGRRSIYEAKYQCRVGGNMKALIIITYLDEQRLEVINYSSIRSSGCLLIKHASLSERLFEEVFREFDELIFSSISQRTTFERICIESDLDWTGKVQVIETQIK